MIEQAEELLIEREQISSSLLMRKFKIPRETAQKIIKKLSKRRRRFKIDGDDRVCIIPQNVKK